MSEESNWENATNQVNADNQIVARTDAIRRAVRTEYNTLVASADRAIETSMMANQTDSDPRISMETRDANNQAAASDAIAQQRVSQALSARIAEVAPDLQGDALKTLQESLIQQAVTQGQNQWRQEHGQRQQLVNPQGRGR